MRTSPGYLAFPEGVDAIRVIIRPEAAYRLIDVPHDAVTNRTFDAEEVFGAAGRRWQEHLANLARPDPPRIRRGDRLRKALHPELTRSGGSDFAQGSGR